MQNAFFNHFFYKKISLSDGGREVPRSKLHTVFKSAVYTYKCCVK